VSRHTHATGPSGVARADITTEPLDGADLLRELGSVADGAVVVFEGRVRAHDGDRRVVRLHYDAYREMAGEVLAEIAQECVDRFDISAVAARHRVGSLAPGEVSLVVAVAGAHRNPAYDASRYVIEELKRRLPVWKKEEYEDGEARWLGGGEAESPISPDAGDPSV